MQEAYRYQGAGRAMEKKLVEGYYSALAEANERKEPVAYLFIGGNVAELLRVFDFHVVYPEVTALNCAIKHRSLDYILKAEDIGYSSDVCAYVKNDIGVFLKNGETPFVRMPRPDLLVCTYSGCNTYIKWFEALQEYYKAPLFILDVPYMREASVKADDVEYIVVQLEELAQLCEQISGKSFDMARLKRILELSRGAEQGWTEVLEMAKRRPSPFDSYFEAVFFMFSINMLRGTQAAVDYYELLKKEMEERSEHKLGPVPNERFRAVVEGPPPWANFRSFWDLFKKWGVCMVASTYTKVGGLWDTGIRHDPSRPLESIAEYALHAYCNWNLGLRRELLRRYLREYSADALIIHGVKSCRSFSVGQGDFREYFTREVGVPTLYVESDLEDPRYYSEAQLRNRVDAFFEALEHQRIVKE